VKREKYSPHREHCTCHLALREVLTALDNLTGIDSDYADAETVVAQQVLEKYDHILTEKF